MKSQLHKLAVFCFVLVLASCSTDNTPSNNDLEGQNGFQFANQVFALNNVYISDDNVVIITNSTIDSETTVSNVDIARFETNQSELNAQSYFVNEELLSCYTATKVNWDKGSISDGNVILQEQNVSSGFFRIKEIDRNIQTVRLIFEFERTDGQLVAGSYEGSYQTTTL